MKKTLSIRNINGINYHFIRYQYLNKPDAFYCNNAKITEERYHRGLHAKVDINNPVKHLNQNSNTSQLFSRIILPLTSVYSFDEIKRIKTHLFEFCDKGMMFKYALYRSLYYLEGHKTSNPDKAIYKAEELTNRLINYLNQ